MTTKVLVASNMFPGPHGPYYGVFVRRQVELLGERDDLQVKAVAITDPRKGPLRSPAKYAAFYAQLALQTVHFRPDVFLFHYVLPTAAPAPLLSLLRAAPYVITVHGGDFYEMRSRIPGGARLFKEVATRAAHIIAVGNAMAEDVRAAMAGDGPLVSVINMGVETERFAATTGPDATKRNSIAYVGQLIGRKGVDLLIDALAQLHRAGHQAQLTLIGDGPAKADLVRQAKALDLERSVWFRGVVQPEELPAALEPHGILAVPSRREPLGLVALEGMAAAMLVVAAPVGGLAELVQHGTNGLHFEPEDSRSLAAALQEALEMPESRAALMRTNARHTAQQHSVHAKVEQIADLLRACSRSRS